jgi:hypothetical protein
MPRTTLQLTPAAMKLAKAHAKRLQITLGEAVSDLVRKGADRPLVTIERDGLHIPVLPPDSPPVTNELIKRLLEEDLS